MKLILASTSIARRTILENAGITPIIVASDIDEHAVINEQKKELSTLEQVEILSRAKAESAFEQVQTQYKSASEPHLLLACDTMFDLHGETIGKPHTPCRAKEIITRLSNSSGTLFTGHTLCDLKTHKTITKVQSTRVQFAKLTDYEIDKYIATDEPLYVAGSFTVDSLGGAFVTSITGDYHNVVGLSLPLLRSMMCELGHEYVDLWE
ncbi:MAG: Maf family nucleotide pyrophosphatase [Bifidobacteriaceae bacterium]|jgi:septum formation protein|nr:Maf family nucleotide pyrophosphatase [Bifidobacteriaceae bacterium]